MVLWRAFQRTTNIGAAATSYTVFVCIVSIFAPLQSLAIAVHFTSRRERNRLQHALNGNSVKHSEGPLAMVRKMRGRAQGYTKNRISQFLCVRSTAIALHVKELRDTFDAPETITYHINVGTASAVLSVSVMPATDPPAPRPALRRTSLWLDQWHLTRPSDETHPENCNVGCVNEHSARTLVPANTARWTLSFVLYHGCS